MFVPLWLLLLGAVVAGMVGGILVLLVTVSLIGSSKDDPA